MTTKAFGQEPNGSEEKYYGTWRLRNLKFPKRTWDWIGKQYLQHPLIEAGCRRSRGSYRSQWRKYKRVELYYTNIVALHYCYDSDDLHRDRRQQTPESSTSGKAFLRATFKRLYHFEIGLTKNGQWSEKLPAYFENKGLWWIWDFPFAYLIGQLIALHKLMIEKLSFHTNCQDDKGRIRPPTSEHDARLKPVCAENLEFSMVNNTNEH